MLSRLRIVSVSAAAILVATAIWPMLASATPVRTTDANRVSAVRLAKRMLAEVVLPAGARQIAKVPKSTAGMLDHPMEAFLIVSQVDRSKFWVTNSSPQAVMNSIKTHLPGPAKQQGSAFSGSEQEVTYSVPTVDPKVLGARQFVFEAVTSGVGTVVRADAEIRYIAPHPLSERIPAGARILDITVGSNLARPLMSLTVTKRSEVHRIAQYADSLPFWANDTGSVTSCPALFGTEPVDRFVFRRTATSPALASISELAATPIQDSPCFSTSWTIQGHHEPQLQDGGRLLEQAGALLHAKLARSAAQNSNAA